MKRDLLDTILCPSCGGGDWQLEAVQEDTVDYEDGPTVEVRNGRLTCACGLIYPIEEYVLSFAQLFPADLAREAAFWDRFYLWNADHGSLGFFDLRKGFTPFMAFGVPDAFPAADRIDRYDVHYAVAENSLMRRGGKLLDIGVGMGWTSLHFARSGYMVTAFDPSLGPMQAAKRYAISQRKRIEYICAAMGHIAFRPDSFSNAAAFHSLHHVPNLAVELGKLSSWVVEGGAFAVDEHICNSRLARAMAGALHTWASTNVFPVYKTISDEELATLPTEPHSEREDASADLIIPLLHSMFTVRTESKRHVFLDHYALLYYLWRGRDMDAYQQALEMANQFQNIVLQVDPDGAEYVTLVVENTRHTPEPVAEPAPVTAHVEQLPDPALEAMVQEAARLAALETALAEARAQLEAAQSRAANLESSMQEQSVWAKSLEQGQKEKQAEVDRLQRQLRRVENGRVMRLLRRVSGKR